MWHVHVPHVRACRYEDWRRTTLGGLRFGKKLRNILLWTIVPALVTLEVGWLHA